MTSIVLYKCSFYDFITSQIQRVETSVCKCPLCVLMSHLTVIEVYFVNAQKLNVNTTVGTLQYCEMSCISSNNTSYRTVKLLTSMLQCVSTGSECT